MFTFHLNRLLQWLPLVNQKSCILWQKYFHWISYRRNHCFADEGHAGKLVKNKHNQCILGYGLEFQPKMVALVPRGGHSTWFWVPTAKRTPGAVAVG